MKKYVFFAVAIAIASLAGCGRRNAAPIHDKEQSSAHSHDDSRGHSHSDGDGHNHSNDGHNHSNDGHDHSGTDKHNHSAHSHSGNDGHDCSAHKHSDGGGHDRSGHNHSCNNGRNCSGTDKHDHAGHNHSTAGHDHTGHSHSDCDGGDHSGGIETVNADEIIFTPEQAARTEFEVQPVRRGVFREVIKCSGTVTAARSEITAITAPVGGIITPSDGRIMQNVNVDAGQRLFTLSSEGLGSGDAIAKARIAYDLAKADFERVAILFKDKLVTNREYLAAEAEYLRAKAEYDPLRNSDGAGAVIITAPAGGYLTEVKVSPGDYVEMGQTLASIARRNRMELRALVSQRYFDRLSGVDDANFRVPSSGGYFTVSAMHGELYSVGRMLSQGSTLIPVIFVFDNNGLIPDGSFAEVSLLGRRREGVLTLPLTAVTEQLGLYYVYVQLDEEGYARREVRLGADDGWRVEILSGVGDGERVVTKGAINVKMAASSSSIPHGHTH